MSEKIHNNSLGKIKPWFIAFTGLMVGLAIVGAFRSYSPIPMGDSWEGNFGFYVKIKNGNWGAWWAQHNEHRIVLSRIFFWLNNQFLGGSNAALIAVNYACVASGTLLYWRILRNIVGTKKPHADEICCGLFLTGWLFLWCQQENLLWEFQNQFILAQLLPLASFFWLYKSKNSTLYFYLACLLGMASGVTMANGILTLPLMTIYALLDRQRLYRVICLGGLAIFMLALYFQNFQSPSHHSTLSQSFQQQPWALIQYSLYYLGSPFKYLFHVKFLATISGIVLILASGLIGIKSLRDRNSLLLSLAFFNFYIISTAFGTAGGRLILGTEHAFASRYTTPALMAWACLFLSFLPEILKKLNHIYFDRSHKVNIAIAAVLALVMLGLQMRALGANTEALWMRKVAALALSMQVNDQNQIQEIVSPSVDILKVSKAAIDLNIGYLGAPPFKDLSTQLNTASSINSTSNCVGKITALTPLNDDTQYLRIEGEITATNNSSVSELLQILNSQHEIIGFALTKKPPQWLESFGKQSISSTKFTGYFLRQQTNSSISLQDTNGQCHLNLNTNPNQ